MKAKRRPKRRPKKKAQARPRVPMMQMQQYEHLLRVMTGQYEQLGRLLFHMEHLPAMIREMGDVLRGGRALTMKLADMVNDRVEWEAQAQKLLTEARSRNGPLP